MCLFLKKKTASRGALLQQQQQYLSRSSAYFSFADLLAPLPLLPPPPPPPSPSPPSAAGPAEPLLLLVAWVVASGEACIGRSKSQFNEEQTLIDKFGWAEKYDGVYVEIGALDGYSLSNTLKLHSCYKWRGVLVEGSQINFDALVQNVAEYRPSGRVRTEYGAVCQPPQLVHHTGLGGGRPRCDGRGI